MNPREADHRLGILLVCASAVPFSLAGIFTRLIGTEIGTVLVWRALIGGAIILLYARRQERGRPMGWQGWLMVLVGGLASVAFIAAFRMTYVANVTLIYAMSPFAAAALDRMIRGVRPDGALLRAAVLSVLGVTLIFAGGFGGVSWGGDLMAGLMMGLFALYIVLIRAFPDAPALTAAAWSGLLPMAAGLALGVEILPGARDVFWLVAFGLSFAVAVILFTEGARRVSAAEAGFYGGLEVPLAVLFAWVVLAETPPATTLAGGALIVGALVWHGAGALKRA
ncbi:MAG TPA: DMT family transporter [Paracoccaceae bacterium]|nr:DMT family transporter [Paracoccaceae bacterium]